jgi:hypothetical protein
MKPVPQLLLLTLPPQSYAPLSLQHDNGIHTMAQSALHLGRALPLIGEPGCPGGHGHLCSSFNTTPIAFVGLRRRVLSVCTRHSKDATAAATTATADAATSTAARSLGYAQL